MSKPGSFLPGTECIIQALPDTGPVGQRLSEMGVLPGSRLQVVRLSPLGDTVEVRVEEGETLALRRDDLERLQCRFLALPAPLAASLFNGDLRVHRLLGGHAFQQRMARHGLAPGTSVAVQPANDHRLLLIPASGPPVTLGRGEALKLILAPIPRKRR
jgi:Fe2+ transport system protein FeoA